MAFDYTEFTELVDELVDEFGQEVSFLKKPRTVVDANAPHRKPAVEVGILTMLRQVTLSQQTQLQLERSAQQFRDSLYKRLFRT